MINPMGFLFPSHSALIRPGRFDMQVTVPRPDVKGRTEILKWYLKKIKVDPGTCSRHAYISQFIIKFKNAVPPVIQ